MGPPINSTPLSGVGRPTGAQELRPDLADRGPCSSNTPDNSQLGIMSLMSSTR